MKISNILAVAVAVTCISVTTAFAAPDTSVAPGINASQQKSDAAKVEKKLFNEKDFKQMHEEFQKDPVKALTGRKEKVQSLVKEGKITKEKADAINARIDLKIKEVQQFNTLNLQQKKDKLINDCKTSLEKRVKEGKLEQAKADTIVKSYTDKITKWDGTGYPQFHHKCFKGKGMHHGTDSKQ